MSHEPDGDLMVGGNNGLMRLRAADATPRWSHPAGGSFAITAPQVQSDGNVLGTGYEHPSDPVDRQQAFVFCE